MTVTYEAIFRADLGKAVPAIGELFNSLNAHLAKDGYDEQLTCHTEVKLIEVTVNRELTEKETEVMKELITKQFQNSMPEYGFSLVEFRRKSGNVSQSAS